jgi:hypothetical protein
MRFGCAFMNDSLLICYYFFLDKKVTKNQDIGDASFAAQAFAHNHLKPRAARICRWYHTYPNASGKSALPLQPHTPTIVLPDSSRSGSAVGKKEEKIIIKTLSLYLWHPKPCQVFGFGFLFFTAGVFGK